MEIIKATLPQNLKVDGNELSKIVIRSGHRQIEISFGPDSLSNAFTLHYKEKND